MNANYKHCDKHIVKGTTMAVEGATPEKSDGPKVNETFLAAKGCLTFLSNCFPLH